MQQVESGTVTLLRHGRTKINEGGLLTGNNNEGLIQFGRDQAEKTAVTLETSGITVIYSSPLLRAIETTEIIAGHLGLNYQELDDLRERDMPSLAGVHESDIDKYAETVEINGKKYAVSSLDGNVAGIEPLPALYARASGVISEMSRNHPTEHVLLVTHSVVGKMLHAVHNGLSWRDGLERLPHFPNASTLRLANN